MRQTCIRVLCLFIVSLFLTSSVLAQAGGSHVVTTRKAAATKVKKTTSDSHKIIKGDMYEGWYNTIRLQYELLASPGIHYQLSYRYSKEFGLGFGLGYECMFHSFNYDYFRHNVPLYMNARFILRGDKSVRPFFCISAGINITFYKIALIGFDDFRLAPKEDYWNTAGLSWNDVRVSSFVDPPLLIVGQAIGMGSLARFEVGCDFRATSKSSVGVSLGIRNSVFQQVNKRLVEWSPFVSIGYTF